MNRILMDMTRAMLDYSGIPHNLWVETVITASYIRNRVPSSAIGNEIPYKRWYGEPPNLSHLRIFGCVAYPLIKDNRQGKLEVRAASHYFMVGYGASSEEVKGYKLWNPTHRKFLISNDVDFVENVMYKNRYSVQKGPKLEILTNDALQETSRVMKSDNIESHHDDIVEEEENEDIVRQEEEVEDFYERMDETENLGQDKNVKSQSKIATREHNQGHSEVREGNSNIIRPVTRSQNNIVKSRLRDPNYVYDSVNRCSIDTDDEEERGYSVKIQGEIKVPDSFSEAIKSEHSKDWIKAMEVEITEHAKKGTWVLVEPDYNMNVISGRWVYAIKGDGKGNIVKLKARWVGRGFAQQHGIDYDETFAPTSHLTSVRLLLSIAAIENLELYQLDVRTAFLNAKLDVKTPVYIEQPHGFVSKGSENLVCRLQKALYGLKQAPRAWYHTLKEWLVKEGFEALKADESIYLKRTTTEYTIVLTHVDDMLVASNTMSNMQSLVNHMKLEFELSTVKPAEFFLGMRITRDRNLRTITIHQGQYVNEILSQFKMSSAEYTRNPLPSHTKIYGNWDPFDRTLYQKLVGKLLYLARCTRPDIATVVNMMCQFTQNPTYGHWYIGKNVMRYLVGKPDVGLVLGGECVNLEAYTDSTWASDIGDRKSRSGGIVYVGNGVVSWYSTKQQVVAKSSSEAEYVAMSTLASEVEWIRSILHELHYRNITPITINTDNRGARFMAENQVSTSRAKHIDIQYHYVKHLVELSRIRIQHVSTTKNVADVLTKGVNDTKHTWCCWMMGLM
ncbi:DNA-directed DNA polymerase [Synchytrium endobioticum]|uniref:DNA-directed DNA polymerase n=1 Tax=Synchytrium endobioticum TaxID=286115 RepID=A0A507C1N5_9FUNG|nr:DNA-directed DNA polymerase [Synchytrium endobioticum]